MARPFPDETFRSEGELELVKDDSGTTSVLYIPPIDALPRGYNDPRSCKCVIAEVDVSRKLLTIYPFKVGGLHSLERRYSTLYRISIEIPYLQRTSDREVDADSLLRSLPSAFIQDYNYGLGFLKDYRHIPRVVESLDVEHLILSTTDRTRLKPSTKEFILNMRDFEMITKKINSIANRARKITYASKHDAVSGIILTLLSPGTKPGEKIYGAQVKELRAEDLLFPLRPASSYQQNEALRIIEANGGQIAKQNPEKILKLKNELELVSLEALIEKFEEMMDHDVKEDYWQRLLEQNPFILNLAFGTPIVKIHGHASVGGRKISGAGDKIADFLVKNSISHTAAVVEIKRPATKLLSATPYRGDLHAPSSEMNGAMNQIIEQIHQLQRNIANLKVDSRIYDLESYNVFGVLIAGNMPEKENERKSFEFYRGNSKNVLVITFDELLMKLKQLHEFLAGDPAQQRPEDDLPF